MKKYLVPVIMVVVLATSAPAAALPQIPKSISKNYKKFKNYWTPARVAAATGIVVGARLLAKHEPRANHLTLKTAVKGFNPKNILGYPKHLFHCVDDLFIGYADHHHRPSSHMPNRSYGLLGNTWYHTKPALNAVMELKKYLKLLIDIKRIIDKV